MSTIVRPTVYRVPGSHRVGQFNPHNPGGRAIIQYLMHGTDGLINNWNTMVSKCGQRDIYTNIGNLQITLFA